MILRNIYQQKVEIVRYGRHTDIFTDGRVLLTPPFARKLARALTTWADVTQARVKEAKRKDGR